jgi:GT2 family glycosyltransferase
MAEFTVVINTIRRSVDLVEKSLRSALAQGDSVRVILLDQNPEPLGLPEEVRSNPRFSHQYEPVPAVSQARNRAQVGADCEWIIFCDDDGYLAPDYLTALKARIAANPGIPIFAGGIRRTDNNEFYSKRHALGGDMRWFWNAKLLMGSNFCVRRDVFEKLGGFDEEFGAGARFGSSEETDFAWKAFFAKVPMMYAPELVVFHVPPFAGDPGGEAEKAYRYGIGKGALVRKWIRKGHFWPFLEVVEMFVLPSFRVLVSFLTRSQGIAGLQKAAIHGRWRGLFAKSGGC